MSAVSLSHLCFVRRLSSPDKEPEVVCQMTLTSTANLVVAFIGIFFLASGLYLLLGGIGTIPATSGGIALVVAGSAALIGALFCHSRKK